MAKAAPTNVATKRSRQTEMRLQVAARAALGDRSAIEVNIADVTGRAGVAASLLYRYFPDLPTLLGKVIADWSEIVFAADDDLRGGAEAFTVLKASILSVVERIDAEPGLFSAVYEASSRFPEAGQAWRNGLERWLKRRMQRLNEEFPGNAFGVEHLIVGLGGLVEGFLIARYGRATGAAAETAGAPDEVSELLALICYRAIYLRNPPDPLISSYQHVAKIGA